MCAIYEVETRTVLDIINDTNAGFINPDPIGQRPPVSSGNKKSQSIIDSILRGYSVGAITVRNIENNKELQKIYPGVRWLVIDGGHRIRAFRDFLKGFFPVDNKIFRSLTEEERDVFCNTQLTFYVYDCTNVQATEIFRRLNTVTPVNTIEMIMANDVSNIAKEIRSRVKSYAEYGHNPIHDIFAIKANNKGTQKAEHWSTDINPRRKWDEFVAVIMLKALGNGNVNAGLEEIASFIEEDRELSPNVLKTTDQFLTDALKIAKAKNMKLNTALFGSLHCVWFGLLERSNFKISNYSKFANEFFRVNSMFKGKNPNKYDNEIITFKTGPRGTLKEDTDTVKKFARMATEYPSNPAAQHQVAEMFLNEMNLKDCITVIDKVRTMDKSTKFDMLASQGFLCFLDGEPLDIEDAIYGHDFAHAKGGKTDFLNGKIIRKSHNDDMGTLSFDEYMMVLEMRKQKEAV
jgi:hypothetical protein